jgi:hypothetical protein
MSESLIRHALLGVSALVSAALGYPQFMEIRCRTPETISKFIYHCMKVIPEDWIFDITKMPKLSGLESLQGKSVVCRSKGPSIAISETLFDSHLNPDSSIGYVGRLLYNDPLRNSSSILVNDLDEDMSELVQEVESNTERSGQWEPEIQGAFIKTELIKVKERHGSFNTSYLERKWSSQKDLPEKDVALKAYQLIARLSPEFIRFDAKGTPLEPLPQGDEATLITEAMTYTLAPQLLKSPLNRRPLTAGYSPGEIALLGALKGLHKNDPEATGFTEAEIEAATREPKSTLYRRSNNLSDKGAIKVTYDKKAHVKHYSLKFKDDEEFPDFILPTWEDYKKEKSGSSPSTGSGLILDAEVTKDEVEREDDSQISSDRPDEPKPNEGNNSSEVGGNENNSSGNNVTTPVTGTGGNTSNGPEPLAEKGTQVVTGASTSKKKGRPSKEDKAKSEIPALQAPPAPPTDDEQVPEPNSPDNIVPEKNITPETDEKASPTAKAPPPTLDNNLSNVGVENKLSAFSGIQENLAL